MVRVHLVCLGAVEPQSVRAIATGIERALGCTTLFTPERIDPKPAFDVARGQYHATPLLDHLAAHITDANDRILGITEVDLFVPIFTFVFGEALLNCPPAILSLHRLSPRFYGLPEDQAIMHRRACVEATHELGHTLGLIHCPDYRCTMHASRLADEIDLKGPGFCDECAHDLRANHTHPWPYKNGAPQ